MNNGGIFCCTKLAHDILEQIAAMQAKNVAILSLQLIACGQSLILKIVQIHVVLEHG